jgi:hypothetical protein
MQPRVYPIDWTHNPICQGRSIHAFQSDAIEESPEQDETGLAADVKTALHISPDKSPTLPQHPILTPSSSIGATGAAPCSSFDCLAQRAPYDFVLLTDCVFAAELAVPLVNTILCCCGPRTTVLCCHEIRDEVCYFAYVIAPTEWQPFLRFFGRCDHYVPALRAVLLERLHSLLADVLLLLYPIRTGCKRRLYS